VTRRRSIALLVAVPAAVVIGSTSALAESNGPGAATSRTTTSTPAAVQQPKPTQRAKASAKPARLTLHLRGVRHREIRVGKRLRAVGYLRPFVAGQRVRVKLLRRGHVIQKVRAKVRKVRGQNAGRYRFRPRALIKPAPYQVTAKHAHNPQQRVAIARSRRFHISYPDLDPGDRNASVRIFNRLLDRQGYYPTHGKRYSNRTGYAVMAFRKTNGMNRTFNATRGIFRKLANRRGRFRLKYPGAGKHVEVDISRQVLVLAQRRKAKYTIPVSTGAPATPTIRGHFRFYSRQPGYNSSGMYYSVYFRGGYATHGYHSVPTYPASHGCVRNPIPLSTFIYNWVDIGMSIYVYG
jgi:L,D-transpeptidase catalytic domain